MSSFLLCCWSIPQKILAYSIYLWTGNIRCGSESVNQTVLRYYLLLLLLFVVSHALSYMCVYIHAWVPWPCHTDGGQRKTWERLRNQFRVSEQHYALGNIAHSGSTDVCFPFQGITDLERFSNCFQSSLYFVSCSVIWT